MGVQKHAPEPESLEACIELAIAVTVVSCHRVSRVRRLNPDLVSASRADEYLDERGPGAEALDQAKLARRELSRVADLDARFSLTMSRHEWNLDSCRSFGPSAFEQREIPFLDTSFAQERMEAPQRAAALRDEQASRGRAIETVRELHTLDLGTQAAQRVYTTERHTAAAVNREPCGLVEHEHPRILVNNALLEPLESARLELRRRALGAPHRRHSDPIAKLDAVARLHTAGVHAYLTGANQTINVAARHTFEACE
jgi:hypothetical protein